MRGIKALVAVMTLMIFVCLGVLIYGFVVKNPFKPVAADASVTLPATSDIRLMSAYSGGLALYVVSPEGEWIYFVDPRQKGEAAKVKIERASAPATATAPLVQP